MLRFAFAVLFATLAMPALAQQKGFSLVDQPDKKKISLYHDDAFLTAYCYFDSTEKPVLWPIKTVTGNTITRGYPIAPRAGERSDHPHHVGLWLNYESVNGLDFWNNSTAIPAERKHLYGSIRHRKVLSSKDGKDKATLETLSHWVDAKGNVLLEETTRFVFSKQGNSFIIDRSCVLKAVADEVVFKDVKDGMLGLRMARALEQPSDQEDTFVDAQGIATTVKKLDNEGVTGLYVNKEGVKGDDAWGKRSVWTCMNARKDGEHISIAIIDHPKNIGYPTYWHARGYGLFAANPLGRKVFSNGKEELNFKLAKGETAAFRYRVVVHSGSTLQAADIDKLAAAWAAEK